MPYVIDSMPQHDHPLDPETEGEAGMDLGVVASIGQHLRVDDSRPEDLQPAGFLAHSAAAAAAEIAVDVDLDAGLGEGEVAAPEDHAAVRSEELVHELFQDALQVGHRDTRSHRQSLNLVELDLAAPGDLLVAVHGAGQQDPDRLGGKSPHRPDLAGGGVGSEPHVLADVEGVLHIAGGVMRRNVQHLEIVLVGLYVRRFPDLEAHSLEDAADLFKDGVDRVHAALPPGRARQGGVLSLRGDLLVELRLLDALLAFLQQAFEFLVEGIDLSVGGLFVLWILEFADLLQQRFNLAFAGEVEVLPFIQFDEGGGGLEILERLGFKF